MQTSWTLPIKIVEERCEWSGGEVEDLARYHVRTAMGNPVGPRLLRGTFPPRIEEWGPFFDREQAEKLRERLQQHIEEYEKRKLRRKVK